MYNITDKRSKLHHKELIDKAAKVLRNTPAEVFSEEQLLNLWSVISSKDDEVFNNKFTSSQIIDKSIGLLDMQDGSEYSEEQLSRIVGLLKRKEEEHQESKPRYIVKSSPFNEGTWGVIDRIETAERDVEEHWVADKLAEQQAIAVAKTLNEHQENSEECCDNSSRYQVYYNGQKASVRDTESESLRIVAQGITEDQAMQFSRMLNKKEQDND